MPLFSCFSRAAAADTSFGSTSLSALSAASPTPSSTAAAPPASSSAAAAAPAAAVAPPQPSSHPDPNFTPRSVAELHPEYAHAEPYHFAARTDSARRVLDNATGTTATLRAPPVAPVTDFVEGGVAPAVGLAPPPLVEENYSANRAREEAKVAEIAEAVSERRRSKARIERGASAGAGAGAGAEGGSGGAKAGRGKGKAKGAKTKSGKAKKNRGKKESGMSSDDLLVAPENDENAPQAANISAAGVAAPVAVLGGGLTAAAVAAKKDTRSVATAASGDGRSSVRRRSKQAPAVVVPHSELDDEIPIDASVDALIAEEASHAAQPWWTPSGDEESNEDGGNYAVMSRTNSGPIVPRDSVREPYSSDARVAAVAASPALPRPAGSPTRSALSCKSGKGSNYSLRKTVSFREEKPTIIEAPVIDDDEEDDYEYADDESDQERFDDAIPEEDPAPRATFSTSSAHVVPVPRRLPEHIPAPEKVPVVHVQRQQGAPRRQVPQPPQRGSESFAGRATTPTSPRTPRASTAEEIRESKKRQSMAVRDALSQQIKGVPRSAMLAFAQNDMSEPSRSDVDAGEDSGSHVEPFSDDWFDEPSSGTLRSREVSDAAPIGRSPSNSRMSSVSPRARSVKSIRVVPPVKAGQIPPPPPPPPFAPAPMRVKSVRNAPPIPPDARKSFLKLRAIGATEAASIDISPSGEAY